MTECPHHPDKKAFPSEGSAKRSLHGIRRPEGGRMKAYRCQGHWHLGHGTEGRYERLKKQAAAERRRRTRSDRNRY